MWDSVIEGIDERRISSKRVVKVRKFPVGENYEGTEIVGKLLQLKSFTQEKLPMTNVILSKPIIRVDTKQQEKVVTDVNNKLSELKRDIIDNGNLDRNHLNGKGLHLNRKVVLLYAENLIDGFRKLWCREKIPKECLGLNFQIPRNNICHDDFNSILTNFNSQGENIVTNSDFIDTNVSLPKYNLNKTLDNAHRNSEIKDLTEKT